MSATVSVIVPVRNEARSIETTLRSLLTQEFPRHRFDVIVADGGSTDGSLATEFVAARGVRAVLTKTGPGRLGAQLRMAYAWCLMQGYCGIVTIDGNGKDNVEAVSRFVARLAAGAEVVQGSRYQAGGKAENTPLERAIGNRLIHAPLMSLAGGRRLTDTTNGFRAYSRRYLLDPRVAPFRDVFVNYELLFYLTVRAGQLGFVVEEIPVERRYPPGQRTPTKITGLGSKLAVLAQTIKAAAGAYRP